MVDVAKSTLIEKLIRFAILAIPVLIFRTLRWGGWIGIIGIAMVVASFVIVNRGESSDSESRNAGWLMLAGVVIYIAGVIVRRRRHKARMTSPGSPIQPPPAAG
jgi:hypothetical protein